MSKSTYISFDFRKHFGLNRKSRIFYHS